MQKYGLKVSSPYDKLEEKLIHAAGDIVLAEPGSYRIVCEGDTYVHHNIVNNQISIVCESAEDDIKIEIKASGKLGTDEVADVYHKIVAKHKNVKTNINARGVVSENGRIIYRSSLAADEDATGTGNQSGKFIILDNTAEVDAEPSLDIYSDLFPTAHAIGVSGINAEKMFYMRAQGMSEDEAKSEIVTGFLNS